ncbi:AlwI family type II restriction endonuclease [Staphylococcus arlettae]|uniref:AlwI family type II restriction endonuclease n=1 Tax=Staphylococcus arlettae TaxID=29378 RepID=UPI0021D3368D|nr:AlwI family type II restriction endonuclease [Staphylococcus arlettae]UXU52551.1 AlwI family type II restriction endonuclease [Staphylococcus arlettae]
MKLNSAKSLFNMGDTSIRVKRVLEVNKLILEVLNDFNVEGGVWPKNNEGQEQFYKMFVKRTEDMEKLQNIKLFDEFSRIENYTEKSKKGLRGRTTTNQIVKLGLVAPNRKISFVGELYRNNNNKKSDKLERLLGLTMDNLIYLRQLLKLRIYSHNSDKYFYNFRFALNFLIKYKNVPSKDFFKIIESIRPNTSEVRIRQIFEEYEKVQIGEELFEDFFFKIFKDDLIPKSDEIIAHKAFEKGELNDENLSLLFTNGKSNGSAFDTYKKFVLSIVKLKNIEKKASQEDILTHLIELSKNSKIKTAFGFNKNPFNIKIGDDKELIHNKILDSALLSGSDYNIYKIFALSKNHDLVQEYSDMCRRVFNVTGLFKFNNNVVNIAQPWVLTPLIKNLDDNDKFPLYGEENYYQYEQNADSFFYNDYSTMEILNVKDYEIDNIEKQIAQTYNTNNIEDLHELIEQQKENEFKSFVKNNYPIHKIKHLLEQIVKRNDEILYDEVTELATVPTILEWLLVIVWYYLSDTDFSLLKSYNMTLDGDNLPLRHAPGGMGDLEIKYNNKSAAILIEATLMDANTQKRGELEPVIRHSVNFNLSNRSVPTYTLFIANSIDENVSNIFRAMTHVNLNGTIEKGTVEGVEIFPVTINELLMLIDKKVTANDIISIIDNNKEKKPSSVKFGWRDNIINQIFR